MVEPTRHQVAPRAAQDSVAGAVTWMAGALLSFLLLGVAARELSSEVSVVQIAFMRNVICVVLLIGLLSVLGWRYARTRRLRRHVARNVVHFGAQLAWFFAVASIPLAEVFAIEFTAPIWTALLASIFLRERLTWVRIVAIALGFIGVLVILRPGAQAIHPAAFAALGAAFGYAVSFVITKDMVATEHPLTILFWMNVIQLPIGFFPSALHWTTPSAALWPWVIVAGMCGLSSHYCLSRAFAHGDVSVVAPLDFLRLPLAAVVAWFLYNEALDVWVFAGAVLVFLGSWLNLARGRA